MVEKNNPLTQVLVADSSTAGATNTDSLATVAAGNLIGFMNYDDNTAFDGSHIPINLSRFYVAYSPTTNETPLLKSTGDYIDVKGIYDVTKVNCSATQAQVIDVNMGIANCSDNYGLRFSIQNGEIDYINGVNPLMKSFVVSPDCPEDDCSCPEGSCVNIAYDLAHTIGLDPDDLFTVEVGYYINPTGGAGGLGYTTDDPYNFTALANATAWNALVTAGTLVIDSDASGSADAALVEAACPIIRITSVPANIESYCATSLNYIPLAETTMVVSPIDGMVSNGSTITEILPVIYARGTGYQVRMMEYIAGGFNGDPGVLRASAYYGAGSMNFTSYADLNSNYTLYYISYNNSVNGGFGQYKDTMRTIIAVPTEDCAREDATQLEGYIDCIIGALADEYNFHLSGMDLEPCA